MGLVGGTAAAEVDADDDIVALIGRGLPDRAAAGTDADLDFDSREIVERGLGECDSTMVTRFAGGRVGADCEAVGGRRN